MKEFKIKFKVDGKETEQYVNAITATEAKKIIEKQYNNSKVTFINIRDLSTGFYH